MSYRTGFSCAALLCALCIGSAWGGEPQVALNFSGLDLGSVAKQVEKVTGRSFLYDENLLRSKRVTLQSDKKISAEEFYRVFQAVCQMNGLAIVPVEDAGIKLEKVVNAQGAFKEPGSQPVLVRGDTLPGGDTMVSYLARLQHVPSARVLAVLTPALSPTGTVQQIPNSELLMINDVSSSVKRLEKLLQLLDVPGEPVTTVSARVINISVDKAQSLLSDYLQAVGKAKTGESSKDKIAYVKDERLGTLHLIGPAEELKVAQDFLKIIDVDSPSARRTIRYYKLKNVAVKDTVEYVSQLLGVALSARAAEKQGNDAAASKVASDFTPAQPLVPINPQPVVAAPPSIALPPPISNKPNAKGASTTKGTFNGGDLPADLIPVEGLNTLVVAGDATVHQEVEAILENLDRRKGQVLIEVAIVQVTGDDSIDLGIEGLTTGNARNNKDQIDGGTGFGIGKQTDERTRGFPTQTALSALTGGAFRYVQSDTLQVVLTALAGKSNVAIVSQPQLLVNDNEQGSFTTKVSQPTTVVQRSDSATNTNLQSFGGFADATTSLEITPRISPDNYLNLEIVQTFEEFTGTSSASGIPPPKVSNNATTKVTIPNRQTIVIGGFTRDSSEMTRTGVPGLMNIPGLGKVFSRETKRKSLSRLYLFVRPIILNAPDFGDLRDASENKKNDVEHRARNTRIKGEVKEGIGRAEVVPLKDEDR